MIDQVKADAGEYGRHVRQGGWRLGLLVARNVEAGAGNGVKEAYRVEAVVITTASKVSAREFAEAANVGQPKGTDGRRNRNRVSADTILAALTAWQKAAAEGLVPDASTLNPGDELDLDLESLPEWRDYCKYPPAGGTRSTKAAIVTAISGATLEALVEALVELERVELVREKVAKAVAENTKVRFAVAKAADKYFADRKERSDAKFAELVGDDTVEALEEEKRVLDAEGYALKASGALRDCLVSLSGTDIPAIRESRLELFVQIVDGIGMRLDAVRSMLTGGISDADIDRFLSEV